VIERVHSGVKCRTGWRDGQMALRWAAWAALETERSFRQIIGHGDLWMLQAALSEDRLLSDESNPIDKGRVAAQDARENSPTGRGGPRRCLA
jgi:hypothetical protein